MKREIIIPPSPAPLPEPETLDAAAILDSLLDGSCDLVCVLGPTASGKTRYAVSLARRFDSLLAERGVRAADGSPARTEIISADSRQVYRGMSIGTGKDLSEYEEVPYHLIDIADAGEKYDIYRYQHDFSRVYEDIRRRGCIALMCGGSGLYIEAATCGYNLPDVPADPQLRAELEQYDDATLTARLAALKPLHNSTDCDSRKRLIRALEIAIYEKEHPVTRSAFMPRSCFYIGMLVSREERNTRIDARLDARLEEGMVEEVRTLMERVKPEDLIYYGLEYKFVTRYLLGELSYGEMRRDLAVAIHQFAKRQMTWFRGMERRGVRIHWVEP